MMTSNETAAPTTPVPESVAPLPPQTNPPVPEPITSQPSPPHPQPNTTYSGILHTGQSLSVGVCAATSNAIPPQPYALQLHDSTSRYDLQNDPNGEKDTLSLAELSEPIRPWTRGALPWPKNMEGVTPAEGLARQVEALRKNRKGKQETYTEHDALVTVHTIVGRGGEGMVGIKKNGAYAFMSEGYPTPFLPEGEGSRNAYDASMYEARAITRLLGPAVRNKRFSYDVVLLTHGETDASILNPHYMSEMIKLQADYAQDLKALTEQTHEPVLLTTQQSTCPGQAGVISPQMQMQWRVQAESRGKVVCVGPKYQYGYSEDTLHMPAGGYRRLGEKMAQVYWTIVHEKKSWQPLAPKKLSRSGDVVKIEMDVMYPPLRWDEHLPKPHQQGPFAQWKEGRGFEARNGEGQAVEIDSVKIAHDGMSVEITLGSGASQETERLSIAYAMTADEDGCNGCLAKGRIGQLCDSDPFISASPIEVEVDVLKGSRAFKGGDALLALYDSVTQGGYILTEMIPERPDHGKLDRAWEGESGRTKLMFTHNQRNYCVQFIADVGDNPWSEPFKGFEDALTKEGLSW